ncbi:hypothetical protein GC096_03765 [Paenibacillus sp. LMG 31461]|uniref:Uncharacterized protein n=1 Tax=Paenibacillus plantarum TaxID=2654975 RepID=A0ABX1X421_9BACL|nr:hypothetical protein [Paenibacillus plantarum]NOU63163.1 hypothetical protein [Paenibacillus plantarum]
MLDKQKLLQWIDDQCDVYSANPEVGDCREDIARFKGSLEMVSKLRSRIEAGNFDLPFNGTQGSEGQNHTNEQYVELALKYSLAIDQISIAVEALLKVQSGIYDCDVSPIVEQALKEIGNDE